MPDASDSGQIKVPSPVPIGGDQRPKRRRYKGRRNPHLGVTIVAPSKGQQRWRLRWRDPDSGAWRFLTLTDDESRTEEDRRDAAIKQWERNAERKAEIRGGAERYTAGNTEIAKAIDGYFAGVGARKADRTQTMYRREADRFVAYLALPAVKIRKCGELNTGVLRAYRSYMLGRKWHGKPVKPATVNASMDAMSAILVELAKGQLIPMSKAAVRDALEREKDKAGKRDFYRSHQLRAILAACAKFDAHHRPSRLTGRFLSTVLFVLLSGMRIAEALRVEWRDVGEDADGRLCIHVRGKGGHERNVYLEHSPLLAHLVSDRRGRAGNTRVIGATRFNVDGARWACESDFVFDSHALRRTCGTFLWNAKGIFEAAAPYLAAQQMGHSVQVAEKKYVGLVQVDPKARTTEDAMDLRISAAEVRSL